MIDPEDPTTKDDAVAESLEEQALERARAHIAELEAEARLGEEVASAAPEQAPTPRKPTREEADAAALEEFQALRRGTPPKKTL